jgi:hypothetical protein
MPLVELRTMEEPPPGVAACNSMSGSEPDDTHEGTRLMSTAAGYLSDDGTTPLIKASGAPWMHMPPLVPLSLTGAGVAQLGQEASIVTRDEGARPPAGAAHTAAAASTLDAHLAALPAGQLVQVPCTGHHHYPHSACLCQGKRGASHGSTLGRQLAMVGYKGHRCCRRCCCCPLLRQLQAYRNVLQLCALSIKGATLVLCVGSRGAAKGPVVRVASGACRGFRYSSWS